MIQSMNNKKERLIMSQQITNSYTYEVNMIVSLFAENEEQALEKLDREGGFVSSRNTKLIKETRVFTPEDES